MIKKLNKPIVLMIETEFFIFLRLLFLQMTMNKPKKFPLFAFLKALTKPLPIVSYHIKLI